MQTLKMTVSPIDVFRQASTVAAETHHQRRQREYEVTRDTIASVLEDQHFLDIESLQVAVAASRAAQLEHPLGLRDTAEVRAIALELWSARKDLVEVVRHYEDGCVNDFEPIPARYESHAQFHITAAGAAALAHCALGKYAEMAVVGDDE